MGLDDLWLDKLLLKPMQHQRLGPAVHDRAAIGAALASALAGTHPLIDATDDHGAAALAAFHQTGEQPLRPALAVNWADGPARNLRLYALPEFVRDDAQMGGFSDYFLCLVERANELATGGRMIHLARAEVDDEADVEPVLQHAVTAFAVAKNGRRGPFAAGRRGDAFRVQSQGDIPRARPAGIGREDTPHDLGLVFIDLPQSPQQLAIRTDDVGDLVAIGQAARHAPIGDGAALATLDVGGDISALLGIEQPAEGSDKVVNHAIRKGEQANVPMLEMTAQFVAVTFVTGNARCRFGEQLLDATGLYVLQQRIHARPLQLTKAGGAAYRCVSVNANDFPAFARRALATDGDLVIDRAAILMVCRIAGVDQGSHVG